MEKKKFPQTVTRVIVLMICAAFLALSGLAILYRVDNKYTAKTGMVQEHVTLLPANGAAFLVDGWELYPDRMLTPHDFSDKAPSPRYTVWAGEYPNLSLFHTDGNPYGAATYRLRIKGEGMAALYLQEPLCAARVFVDGRDLGGPGEVGDVYEAGGADMDRGQAGSYRPLIRDTVYSFPVDGEAELIIQTANYSHYYGGLWFPPMVGSTDSVVHMAASRMIFYGILCFSALALALRVEEGLHHTAIMHSQNVSRLNLAARTLKTSIFVKNGPSYAGIGVGGEGFTTFTIATPTGEGTTSARTFARLRRCVLTNGFSIR